MFKWLMVWCPGSESGREVRRGIQLGVRALSGIGVGLAAACSGCGGGGSEAQDCQPKAVTVALAGDSTLRGPEDPASPFRTAALLQAALGGPVDGSQAIGGTKLQDLIDGTRGMRKWPAGFESFAVIVIGFGANEAAHLDALKAAAGFAKEMGLEHINERQRAEARAKFRANLEAVAADPRVVLRTPLPMDTRVFDPLVNNRETAAYAQVVREVAIKYRRPLIDAYAWTLLQPGWESQLRDKLHPRDEFYARLARELYAPALSIEIAKLPCQ